MNLWIATPTTNILHNAHFYSWEKGLKTGIYYLRSRALTSAQTVVLDPKAVEKAKQKTQSSQSKGSPSVSQPRGSPSVSHFKITDQHIDEPGELDKSNELDNPNPAVYPTEQTSESDKISTHRDETPRRQRKTFQRGGRTFECFDDVCVSCGS
jgi:ribonucleotide reductase alpha subunit